MAAADPIDVVRTTAFIPEADEGNYGYPLLRKVGVMRFYPLRKKAAQGFYFDLRVNTNAVSGAAVFGVTLNVILVDLEGVSSAGAGLVVRLGVTAKLLATGADVTTFAGSDTEVAYDVTMDATTGELVLADLALLNADLEAVAAGGRLLFYVRRIGTHANDTHQGTIGIGTIEVRESAAT
jgi:hypothetical protein